MPIGRAANAMPPIGSTQAPRSATASRRNSDSRDAVISGSWLRSLAAVTQITASAGSATTMAKNEFQNPSADRSNWRMASLRPIIRRKAALRNCWISSAEGICVAQPNQSSRKRS